jgi:hypothetical protein
MQSLNFKPVPTVHHEISGDYAVDSIKIGANRINPKINSLNSTVTFFYHRRTGVSMAALWCADVEGIIVTFAICDSADIFSRPRARAILAQRFLEKKCWIIHGGKDVPGLWEQGASRKVLHLIGKYYMEQQRWRASMFVLHRLIFPNAFRTTSGVFGGDEVMAKINSMFNDENFFIEDKQPTARRSKVSSAPEHRVIRNSINLVDVRWHNFYIGFHHDGNPENPWHMLAGTRQCEYFPSTERFANAAQHSTIQNYAALLAHHAEGVMIVPIDWHLGKSNSVPTLGEVRDMMRAAVFCTKVMRAIRRNTRSEDEYNTLLEFFVSETAEPSRSFVF